MSTKFYFKSEILTVRFYGGFEMLVLPSYGGKNNVGSFVLQLKGEISLIFACFIPFIQKTNFKFL